jgi:hypothetical protein
MTMKALLNTRDHASCDFSHPIIRWKDRNPPRKSPALLLPDRCLTVPFRHFALILSIVIVVLGGCSTGGKNPVRDPIVYSGTVYFAAASPPRQLRYTIVPTDAGDMLYDSVQAISQSLSGRKVALLRRYSVTGAEGNKWFCQLIVVDMLTGDQRIVSTFTDDAQHSKYSNGLAVGTPYPTERYSAWIGEGKVCLGFGRTGLLAVDVQSGRAASIVVDSKVVGISSMRSGIQSDSLPVSVDRNGHFEVGLVDLTSGRFRKIGVGDSICCDPVGNLWWCDDRGAVHTSDKQGRLIRDWQNAQFNDNKGANEVWWSPKWRTAILGFSRPGRSANVSGTVHFGKLDEATGKVELLDGTINIGDEFAPR